MTYEWMDIDTERRVASAMAKQSNENAERGALWFNKYLRIAAAHESEMRRRTHQSLVVGFIIGAGFCSVIFWVSRDLFS